VRLALVLAASVLLTPVLLADHQHIVSDDEADFASFKTFAIREGRAATTRPELNNRLIFEKVADAIRSELLAKGLRESADVPDVFVGFSIGEDRPNGPSVIFNEGTLLIDVTTRENPTLVWQGVYTDEKSSPAKVADKLKISVKKLLAAYPPKKRK
jgi:Domain of unknown function (DUF4136)